MRSLFLACIAFSGMAALTACSPPPPAGPPTASGSGSGASPTADSGNADSAYTNAFAYCRSIGTIDRPDARYTGRRPPPAVIAGLMKVFGAPPAASRSYAFTRSTSWRCMGGHVYACTVGANLPCQSPANTRRNATGAENRYCAAHPNSDFIPMSVTGHDTIYAWHCKGRQAVAGKQVSRVDARGYIADIWYRIPAPSAATD